MTTSPYIKRCRFYCTLASECIYNGIVGFEITGCPIVDVTDEEAYLYNKNVSRRYGAEVLHNQQSEGNDMLRHDIDFLCELGNQNCRYDLFQMYDISHDEIEKAIKTTEGR